MARRYFRASSTRGEISPYGEAIGRLAAPWNKYPWNGNRSPCAGSGKAAERSIRGIAFPGVGRGFFRLIALAAFPILRTCGCITAFELHDPDRVALPLGLHYRVALTRSVRACCTLLCHYVFIHPFHG